jgi:hypothetical protein
MRRMILLTLCLVLVLAMAPPASAVLNNIVTNGDFEASPDHLVNWSQAAQTGGRGAFTSSSSGSNDFAVSASSSYESEMWQVINAATSTGWIPGGTAQTYNFSMQYVRQGTFFEATAAEYGLWYFDSNPVSAPAFGTNADTPNAGWHLLSGNTDLDHTNSFQTVTASGTIAGFQPQWFAVTLEGQTLWDTDRTEFDNISLTTQCTPSSAVPIPPTALLLGSGLLGLVGLGWRRKKTQ